MEDEYGIFILNELHMFHPPFKVPRFDRKLSPAKAATYGQTVVVHVKATKAACSRRKTKKDRESMCIAFHT